MNQITVVCSVSQVRTLADNGIRVSLDFPEDAIREAAMLMECRRQGIPLLIIIQAHETKKPENNSSIIPKGILDELPEKRK